MWQDDKGCNTADEEQYSLHQFQVVFVLFSSRRLFGHGSSMEDLFFSFFVDGTSLPETAYLRMGNRSWQWLPIFSGHQLVCYGSIPHNTNDPFHSTYLYSSVPVFSCPIGLCSTGLDVSTGVRVAGTMSQTRCINPDSSSSLLPYVWAGGRLAEK